MYHLEEGLLIKCTLRAYNRITNSCRDCIPHGNKAGYLYRRDGHRVGPWPLHSEFKVLGEASGIHISISSLRKPMDEAPVSGHYWIGKNG